MEWSFFAFPSILDVNFCLFLCLLCVLYQQSFTVVSWMTIENRSLVVAEWGRGRCREVMVAVPGYHGNPFACEPHRREMEDGSRSQALPLRLPYTRDVDDTIL